MKRRFVVFLFALTATTYADEAIDQSRRDCPDESLCFIEVPGARCSDGTQTGFSLMYRKGAKSLYLFLDGGGACWSKETCEKGTATHLTAETPYQGPYFKQSSAAQLGWFDLNNPNNPISNGFSLARVPYCTADVFMGNQTNDYGTPTNPNVFRHVGYRNLSLILAELGKRFPNPERILFMGTSAGGLGVTYNIHQLRSIYPHTKLFALNDGGIPFKTPHVASKKLELLNTMWGTQYTSPMHSHRGHAGENLASDMVQYNQENFPDVAYGMIMAYKDWTMSLFARLLGAPNFTLAVHDDLIDLADGTFSQSSNYKVFYLQDFWHSYTLKNPATVVSQGVKFNDWVNAMLAESADWTNVRPDKP